MDKSSFILYTDYYEQIEMLTIEQRGMLLTACMLYQLGEDLPEMDPVTKMCYLFISADMRRNNEKYERIVEQRAEAGRKGGKQTQANKANATFASNAEITKQANQANQANASDNDNDNDNENVNDNDNDNDNGNVNENVNVNVNDLHPQTPSKGAGRQRFTKPTVEEVALYCQERMNGIDAQEFIDFYESKGWMIGKSPMKDWKACVRTWERSRKNKEPPDRYADIDDWYRRRTASDQGGIFDYQPGDQSSVSEHAG